ncbi:MAG: hypothetical protein ACKVE4_04420 [Dissulfuribacterales bacterium]
MRKSAYIFFISAFIVVFLTCLIPSAFGLKTVSKNLYLGAIVVDAATGNVLVEDHADTKGYPASMIKLMNLLIILEAVDAGHITYHIENKLDSGLRRNDVAVGMFIIISNS